VVAVLRAFRAAWFDASIADNPVPVPGLEVAAVLAAGSRVDLPLPGLSTEATDAVVPDVLFWLLPVRAACV
jgi:hypothetical protein